ncbi:hypothetical protein B0H21DRAFT_551452 [Amylocystis lapponica]|nr:hypothetical protein B0H21DRAFT_551452 [Amylocystis lapponica]
MYSIHERASTGALFSARCASPGQRGRVSRASERGRIQLHASRHDASTTSNAANARGPLPALEVADDPVYRAAEDSDADADLQALLDDLDSGALAPHAIRDPFDEEDAARARRSRTAHPRKRIKARAQQRMYWKSSPVPVSGSGAASSSRHCIGTESTMGPPLAPVSVQDAPWATEPCLIVGSPPAMEPPVTAGTTPLLRPHFSRQPPYPVERSHAMDIE